MIAGRLYYLPKDVQKQGVHGKGRTERIQKDCLFSNTKVNSMSRRSVCMGHNVSSWSTKMLGNRGKWKARRRLKRRENRDVDNIPEPEI